MELLNTTIAMYKDIDLWEAWVDRQPMGMKTVDTFYVLGEVTRHDDDAQPVLVRKRGTIGFSTELHLQLKRSSPAFTGSPEEVCYSEVLDFPKQYTKVIIHCGDDVIAEINDIEIIGEK